MTLTRKFVPLHASSPEGHHDMEAWQTRVQISSAPSSSYDLVQVTKPILGPCLVICKPQVRLPRVVFERMKKMSITGGLTPYRGRERGNWYSCSFSNEAFLHLNPKEISLPLAFLAVLFDHTTRKANSLDRVHTDSPFTRTEDWKSFLDLGLPKPAWLFSALCCPLLVHNVKNQLPTLPTGLYFLWRMMMIMRKATLSS